jgi:methyl-accepting chemotaxis protein
MITLYTNNDEYYFSFLKIYDELISSGGSSFSDINENDSTEINENVEQPVTDIFTAHLTKFKNHFASLVKMNKVIGRTYKEGLEGKLRSKSQEFDNPVEAVYDKVKAGIDEIQYNSVLNVLIIFSLLALIFFILFWRFSLSVVAPLNNLRKYIEPLSKGVLPEEKPVAGGENEISQITESINDLIDGLKKQPDLLMK